MSIRLVSFDFWGTIYHNDPPLGDKQKEVILQYLKNASVSQIEKTTVHDAYKAAWKRWDAHWKENYRTPAVREWVTMVLEYLDVELADEYIIECCTELQSLIFAGNTKEIPGVRAALESLHQNCDLSIISDTAIESGEYLRRLLRKDKLDYFGYSIFSNEFGRSKPHSSVFEALLTHFRVGPEEAVHVGDLRRTDVAGAKSVGIHTVRFSGCHNDRNSDQEEADFVIHNYALLPDIVESLF